MLKRYASLSYDTNESRYCPSALDFFLSQKDRYGNHQAGILTLIIDIQTAHIVAMPLYLGDLESILPLQDMPLQRTFSKLEEMPAVCQSSLRTS